MPRIPGRSPHLSPYLGPAVPKLPGDDAPPVEPPPALKERIMDVVHAEARAAADGPDPVVLRASTSSASAPGAGGTLTLHADRMVLRAWGLPAPSSGRAYRLWLLSGDGPGVPDPGPLLRVDADGGASVELPVSASASELVVALDDAAPALRVSVPAGVAARACR